MFQDYLFFGVDNKVFYSFRILHMSKIANHAKDIHGLNINRALLLSDALVGGLLLSSLLDYGELINLRFQSGSNFTLGVEATYLGEVRGYLECNEDSEVVKNIDLGIKINHEFIVRSIRTQKNNLSPFQGSTKIISDNICDALNDHLKNSYQMNTGVKISSWYDENSDKIRAYGLIYQELPGIPEEVSEKLLYSMNKIKDLKTVVIKNEDPDILLKNLIPDEIKGVKSINPEFICNCTKEKIEQVLCILPKEELLDIIKKEEDVNIKCHYCSKKHIINSARAKELFVSLASQTDTQH